MVKTTKKTQKTDDEQLDLATGILTRGLERIDEYVQNPSNSDLGSDSSDALARLLTKVAQVAGELRKAKAEERRQANLNTPEAIIAAARALTPRERANVVREIEHAGSGKSGLA